MSFTQKVQGCRGAGRGRLWSVSRPGDESFCLKLDTFKSCRGCSEHASTEQEAMAHSRMLRCRRCLPHALHLFLVRGSRDWVLGIHSPSLSSGWGGREERLSLTPILQMKGLGLRAGCPQRG